MPHLVRISSTGDVQSNSMKTFQVEGKSVLLANVGGKPYAIGAICNHARWDLSMGTLRGEEVVCAGHGSIWNLKTGVGKFVRPLPPQPVYKVEVKRDDIFIELE